MTSKTQNNQALIIKKDEEIDQLKKDLESYKTQTGGYSLIKSPISNKQLLMILQRTPKEHVRQRPGKGGGTWDYVTGVYIRKVLNYVFGWLWDFQIIDKGKEGEQVWVSGRLTIKNEKGEVLIIKEQFGGADIKFRKGTKSPLDYANDLKAAATDALKKCASELGIASDIYGKNEFRDIQKKGFAKNPLTPSASAKIAKKENTQIDYLLKLKNELVKKGAKTEAEAVNIYNRITGENIKSLKVAQSTAQKYLFNLLNSPTFK